MLLELNNYDECDYPNGFDRCLQFVIELHSKGLVGERGTKATVETRLPEEFAAGEGGNGDREGRMARC
jgi:hypothetical protein